MLVTYLIVFSVLLLLMLSYFKVANYFDVVDYPIKRSSHQRPTIRGGGIIFPVAILIWFLISGWKEPLAVAGLMVISIISFIDDLKSLRYTTRIIFHFIAIALLFIEILPTIYWYWIAAALILAVSWINAFNFMDGINGITAFYSLVLLGSFSLLNNAKALLSPLLKNNIPVHWEAFIPAGLVGTLFISVIIFAIFNVRKRAVTFPGDVGSISMAFLHSWMMINLMIATKEAYWILFFAVYGIDSGVTIILRLLEGHNILKAHRFHLYQILVNERKQPHLVIAGLYAVIQGTTNLIVIYLYFVGLMNLITFSLILMTLLVAYIFLRFHVNNGQFFKYRARIRA
jgi:UDP-GlcNAc:undecaprenyl-phosphate GlcNAc-1-phosphate transferase